MCGTCGCGTESGVRVTTLDGRHHANEHQAHHGHRHDGHPQHDHPHADASSRTVSIEQDILAKNDALAERNRVWLATQRIRALNLMSSPGAGKTTLLERTIRELGADLAVSVIEGDQETLLDAERIKATGAPVVQVNTGAGCHLDADMLERALHQLDPPSGSLLFIENVGNLVCPAMFDLGEAAKVVIISVTEGDDKPLKYPQMFAAADVVLVNKTDLLPYVDFDVEQCAARARQLKPDVFVLPVSARTGTGCDSWYDWLLRHP